TFAAYACNAPVILAQAAGSPLAAILHDADAALAFVQKIKFGMMVDVVSTNRQLIRSLRGMTREPGSFDDETFDEARFEARIADGAEAGSNYAIRTAHGNGFRHIEAIAYEVAARFHRGRGHALIADAFVREAHTRYLRWGADGKARQLRHAFPELALQPTGPAT